MGIKGFWSLVSPAGHRLDIVTLAGKRLAVDASIWLVQFLKVWFGQCCAAKGFPC